MSTEKKQSAISEVRDQLSLDFADDNYLTIVGQNLGLQRPVLGFNDTTWRAVVKELALEYRQISTKFHDILAIIIGPQVTQVGTLVESVSAGEKTCILNDTTNMPQKGTLVFDDALTAEDNVSVAASAGATSITVTDSSEFPTVYPYTITLDPDGTFEETVTVTNNAANVLTFTEPLANSHVIGTTVVWGTREVVEYCLIDRRYNQIYLDTELVYDHIVMEFDAEQTILSVSPANEVVVPSSASFPNADSTPTVTYPYTIVLGRGTPEEEILYVQNNDIDQNILTLGAAPANTHARPIASDIKGELLQDYFLTSSFVTLEDTTQFPEAGLIKLVSTDIFTVLNAGTGPTDRTIDFSASTFEANSLAGYEIVFDTTTTTAALRGLTRQVVSNTDALITVSEDFSVPGTEPQATDTFTLRPIVAYTDNDTDTGNLTLSRPIVQPLTILTNSYVDLMTTQSTVALAPVKNPGKGWDVIQSTPGLVELLIPEELLSDNDLRSSSYIHDDTITALPSTTTTAASVIGDTEIFVTTAVTFPVAGIVRIAATETVAYHLPVAEVLADPLTGLDPQIGDTILPLVDSSDFPASGTVIIGEGTRHEETVAFSANDIVANKLTVSALTQDHTAGQVTRCLSVMKINSELVVAHAPGALVDFYQLFYAPSYIPKGDYNQNQDVWPGPYVYKIGTPAPTPTGGSTTPSTIVPGTNRLSIGQVAGRTALEIEDGLSILPGLIPPFDCLIGAGTTTVETVSVVDINIRGRALTTVATTAVAIGDTSIEVAGLGTPGLNGEEFPDANGYRVVLNEELLAASTAVSSPGSPGGVTFFVVDNYISSGFPTTYPYRMVINPGTVQEEIHTVTNSVGNIVTISAPLANALATGDEVAWDPKEVVYVTGTLTGPNRLTLSEPAVQTHAIASSVSLLKDVLTVESLSKDHEGLQTYANRSTNVGGSAAFYHEDDANPTLVNPILGDIELVSVLGMDTSGDRVILNFGNGQIARADSLNGAALATATSITLNDASDFPSTYPYTIRLGGGLRNEELLQVTGKAGNVLTLGGGTYGLLFAHVDGEAVSWDPGDPETIEYDEIDGNELRFDSGIMLQYTHYPVETVLNSSADSDPDSDGYDFPLRMPDDIRDRLQYLIDIIRAAGVQVAIIEER